jgi:hypothetical protein
VPAGVSVSLGADGGRGDSVSRFLKIYLTVTLVLAVGAYAALLGYHYGKKSADRYYYLHPIVQYVGEGVTNTFMDGIPTAAGGCIVEEGKALHVKSKDGISFTCWPISLREFEESKP